ncbi:hypothetical protein AJ88_15655 [Mesorhizobium amorphae CCBAU 01583]|nr:hypothetical protein AJ88_15655 [Mesorhizobium amorphae CCBAU 01583]
MRLVRIALSGTKPPWPASLSASGGGNDGDGDDDSDDMAVSSTTAFFLPLVSLKAACSTWPSASTARAA